MTSPYIRIEVQLRGLVTDKVSVPRKSVCV